MKTGNEYKLSTEEKETLLNTLKTRFEKNKNRHAGLDWTTVQTKLLEQPQKLWSLNEMENTGGEPDVVGYDKETQEFLFVDCSTESPKGRRSTCYDREAQVNRKDFPPKHNAQDMATAMGISLLTEEQYRNLQQLGNFDSKTSSWIQTPEAIRKLGGAIFADFRYNHIFIYHNGAQSYYAARGFRGLLKV
ncbi:DUF4256 domain-containing protein [Flavobacterium sp. IMCC34852]|uniref:DUF4256 domain-containing protein n=1 Tax=Flavobacterium rivulicola TaxID=2732161 RepID=A0A7Y3R7L0_9FLAO|nr:DUF4256 domain-containing protein [Flavobacterium sp. IMCC34852]NNT71413.1 DUF4256 domain-containing protein [Flavobacterium sp. IMCC34852]